MAAPLHFMTSGTQQMFCRPLANISLSNPSDDHRSASFSRLSHNRNNIPAPINYNRAALLLRANLSTNAVLMEPSRPTADFPSDVWADCFISLKLDESVNIYLSYSLCIYSLLIFCLCLCFFPFYSSLKLIAHDHVCTLFFFFFFTGCRNTNQIVNKLKC